VGIIGRPNSCNTCRHIREQTIVSALIAIVLVVAGCAPTEKAPEATQQSDAATAAVTIEWSENSDCATCHIVEEASFEDEHSIAALHTSYSCIQCHSDTGTLGRVHEGVTADDWAPKRLKLTQVNQDICLSCHNLDDLAQATSGSTVLTDLEGATSNQHQLPISSSGIHQEILCGDCHSLHADSSTIAKDAKDYCVSCHHAEVFECYTCHEHG
jgi:hypothetical protein